jgi:DNA polymerase-3 subunit alpha
MKRLKEINAPACAITDHGGMFNILKFYMACKANGIKSILGFEAYVAHDRSLKSKSEMQVLAEELDDDFVHKISHLVLLAKNFNGYQNLVKLTSLGYAEGFYGKPRIDFNDLKQYSEGVICINGHVGTRIAQAFERYDDAINNPDSPYDADKEFTRAYTLNQEYLDLFGDDYYLEIQNHGLNIEKITSPLMIQLAKDSGVKLVITNDSHYTWKTDAEPHRIHMSNGIGKTYEEFMNGDFEGFATCDEFYIKSDEEMYEVANEYGEDGIQAMLNTLEVADKCNVELDAIEFIGAREGKKKWKGLMEGNWKTKDYLFPKFDIPAPYANANEYLKYLSIEGLKDRLNSGELDTSRFPLSEYEERLEYELDVIIDMGFPTYFLILWDVLKFCRDNDIPVGKGRGSGAGSLALYSLRITDVDPLPYELIFQRFLNPDRISLPDVDLDFCYDRIDEVVVYTKEKYGYDFVCKIGTFGTLGAKAVIKDVAKVLKYDYQKINSMTTKIGEIGITIDDILATYKDFAKEYEEDELFKRIIDNAKRLEGLQRHTSKHAAGVIISPFPLAELIPLVGDGLDLTSQWDMGDCEVLGFVKMDYLRLRTLTVIKNTVQSIFKHTGEYIDIDKIQLDNELVYENFQKGNSLSIFQFESTGMQALLKRQKPKSIDDLSAVNSLYRPGPLDMKIEDPDDPNFGKTMVDIYVERASGAQEVVYDHPLLESVLKDTYGVMVFQEQLMKVSVVLAGYTLAQSDELRKVVGKKLLDKMPEQHDKFVDGCLRNPSFIDGCGDKDPKKLAEFIFSQIQAFGRYGFNRSHSTAYAILGYQSMWLKTNYPVHFMASVLTSLMGGKIEAMIPYLNECRVMGIKVLAPDINMSSNKFEVSKDGKGIHFGLVGIKGVGEKAVANILEIKERHSINSILDLITLTGSMVNKTVVCALVKCGAFDFLGYNRRTLLKTAEELIQLNSDVKKKITANKKRKKPLTDISSFYNPLYDYTIEEVGEFTLQELCSLERELTGFYMSYHPLDGLIDHIRSKSTNTSNEINIGLIVEKYIDDDLSLESGIEEAVIYERLPVGQTVITGGFIKSVNISTIKSGRNKGKEMARFVIEDAYQGDISCTAFSETFGKYKNILNNGSVVFVKGNIDYYQDNAQIIVQQIKEVNRGEIETKANESRFVELSALITNLEEEIELREETIALTIALLRDDYELISNVCQELNELYAELDRVKHEIGEVVK